MWALELVVRRTCRAVPASEVGGLAGTVGVCAHDALLALHGSGDVRPVAQTAWAASARAVGAECLRVSASGASCACGNGRLPGLNGVGACAATCDVSTSDDVCVCVCV